MTCLSCGGSMTGPHHGYWYECSRCGFLASDLPTAIGSSSTAPAIDEERRSVALQSLRRAGFERVLDTLGALALPGQSRILDVGCAHGWFLDAASARGYSASGLEPDREIAAMASARGHVVHVGFFPADVPSGERYDILTFHDVFEHLPEPREALAACHRYLREGGLLVLNLPSSRGALFLTAKLMARLGLRQPLDRMWQRGFPSPHLTYFSPGALATFVSANGFREVHRSFLPSLARTGLWQRLRYDRRSSVLAAGAAYVGLSVAGLVLPFLPQDISLQVFRREP